MLTRRLLCQCIRREEWQREEQEPKQQQHRSVSPKASPKRLLQVGWNWQEQDAHHHIHHLLSYEQHSAESTLFGMEFYMGYFFFPLFLHPLLGQLFCILFLLIFLLLLYLLLLFVLLLSHLILTSISPPPSLTPPLILLPQLLPTWRNMMSSPANDILTCGCRITEGSSVASIHNEYSGCVWYPPNNSHFPRKIYLAPLTL